MIEVRWARREELKEFPAAGFSVERYAVDKDGVTVVFLGVNAASLVGKEGYPWFISLRPDLYSRRELVRCARSALTLWAQKYDKLVAVAEEGEHVGWFRFLGFHVDKVMKPIYAGGKTMVYMEYRHGGRRPTESSGTT